VMKTSREERGGRQYLAIGTRLFMVTLIREKVFTSAAPRNIARMNGHPPSSFSGPIFGGIIFMSRVRTQYLCGFSAMIKLPSRNC
jgi:hypothetical protein